MIAYILIAVSFFSWKLRSTGTRNTANSLPAFRRSLTVIFEMVDRNYSCAAKIHRGFPSRVL